MSTAVTWDEWQIGFHETMAEATKVKVAVSRQATIFELAPRLWRLSRHYRKLLELYWDLESMHSMNTSQRDQLADIAKSGRELYQNADSMLMAATGLTNRSLTGGSLASIRKSNEELLDWIEVLELALDPVTAEKLERAAEASKRNDVVYLE